MARLRLPALPKAPAWHGHEHIQLSLGLPAVHSHHMQCLCGYTMVGSCVVFLAVGFRAMAFVAAAHGVYLLVALQDDVHHVVDIFGLSPVLY